MGLILNYDLIFTNFCGPRWLWSLFGTNFCDFLRKRMVINNEANPIFSTFLLVTSQHKMWSSFSDVFFLIIIFLPFPSANWCQHWFEFFPNPPVNILGMVENILVHHDKRLMEHFVNCNVTSQVTYALFCFPVPTVCRLSWLFWLISSLPDVRLAIATDALIWSSNQGRVVESLG